jgi:hypothetical protein
MNALVRIEKFRRVALEEYIERLIALLDNLDGDQDLEDGSDAEPEETDQDGDEQDCSHSEEEWSPHSNGALRWDGLGVNIANDLLGGLPDAARRREPAL